MNKPRFSKKVKINVTARDIANGIPEDCSACPIARAVNRRLGLRTHWKNGRNGDDVTVGSMVLVASGGKRRDYYVPNSAKKFIKRFDRLEDVKPFTFTMSACGNIRFV